MRRWIIAICLPEQATAEPERGQEQRERVSGRKGLSAYPFPQLPGAPALAGSAGAGVAKARGTVGRQPPPAGPVPAHTGLGPRVCSARSERRLSCPQGRERGCGGPEAFPEQPGTCKGPSAHPLPTALRRCCVQAVCPVPTPSKTFPWHAKHHCFPESPGKTTGTFPEGAMENVMPRGDLHLLPAPGTPPGPGLAPCPAGARGAPRLCPPPPRRQRFPRTRILAAREIKAKQTNRGRSRFRSGYFGAV